MKAKTYLGKMPSGTVLRGFLALCILMIFITGCKKDKYIEPENNNPPAILTAQTNINRDTVPPDGMIIYSWQSNAKYHILEIKEGGIVILRDSLIEQNGSRTYVMHKSSTFISTFYGDKSVPPIICTKNVVVSTATVNNPTIHLTATPNPTDGSGDVTITVIASNFNYIITDIPGASAPGTFRVSISKTTTFHGEADGENGLKAFDSVIVVFHSSTTPTFMDIITEHPWSVISGVRNCAGDENGIWDNATLSQEDLDVKYVFCTDGNWEAYRYGVKINWDTFSITDSILIWGGGHYEIKVLNSTTMTLKHGEMSIGCPGNYGYVKRTYGPAVLKK
jgi:hypothetical protein